MGKAFSALRQPTNIERLDRLIHAIQSLEDRHLTLEHMKQTWMENVISYGIGLYFIVGTLVYLFYFPEDKVRKRLCALVYALYPILLFLLKGFVSWCFLSRIKKTSTRLNQLKSEKKRVVDLIMDMEPFKTFKNCLDKSEEDYGNRSTLTSKSYSVLKLETKKSLFSQNGRPGTPCANKSFIDKLLEYIAGDGINDRYALICCICKTHNGLALREEFEYIGYKCRFCHYYNPPKKIRPSPPKLILGCPQVPALRRNEEFGDQASEMTTNKSRIEFPNTIRQIEPAKVT